MRQILISHWGLQIRKIPAIVGVTFPDSSILSFQLRECFAEHKEGWEEGGSTREQPYGPRGWRILEYTGSQTYSSEEAMAPHSSTLAWKIPWTEEPGRLQSTESQRVGHDWVISLSCIGEGNGNPLQCSCLENPRDGGAWWAAVYGVAQSRTRLKWLSSSRYIPSRAISGSKNINILRLLINCCCVVSKLCLTLRHCGL